LVKEFFDGTPSPSLREKGMERNSGCGSILDYYYDISFNWSSQPKN